MGIESDLALGSFLARMELNDLEHVIRQLAWEQLRNKRNTDFVLLVLTSTLNNKVSKILKKNSTLLQEALNSMNQRTIITVAPWNIQRRIAGFCSGSETDVIKVIPPEEHVKVFIAHGVGFTAFAVKGGSVIN